MLFRSRDWPAELDELFKETTTFVKSVKSEMGARRSPPPETVEAVAWRPTAKSVGSDGEELRKRVASFRAHQQRTIREREAYAASVLSMLKAILSAQS